MALALVVITLLYSTKERALFIAPPIGILAAAVVWYLLGDTLIEPRRRLLLSVGAGVIVAELTAWDASTLSKSEINSPVSAYLAARSFARAFCRIGTTNFAKSSNGTKPRDGAGVCG